MRLEEGDNDSTSMAKRIEVVGEAMDLLVGQLPGQPKASVKPTYDEHTGEILDPDLVKQAKREELVCFRKKGVWRVISPYERSTGHWDPVGQL